MPNDPLTTTYLSVEEWEAEAARLRAGEDARIARETEEMEWRKLEQRQPGGDRLMVTEFDLHE